MRISISIGVLPPVSSQDVVISFKSQSCKSDSSGKTDDDSFPVSPLRQLHNVPKSIQEFNENNRNQCLKVTLVNF